MGLGRMLGLARAPPTLSPAQLKETLTVELAGLDRAGKKEKRQRAARLAALLNTVEGAEATVAAVDAMNRARASAVLLEMLDAALDDGDSDDDDSASAADDLLEADLELSRSLLSCLASYAFLGGAPALQEQGGVLQLLRLMDHSDPTIRAYSSATLQNATAFLELIDVRKLGESESRELEQLESHRDPTISGPAKKIRANLEQDRRFQEGQIDRAAVAADLEAREREGGTPGYAAAGDAWWEQTRSLKALSTEDEEAPPTTTTTTPPEDPTSSTLELQLRLGGMGYGLHLTPAPAPPSAPPAPPTIGRAASSVLKLHKALGALSLPAPGPAAAPASAPAAPSRPASTASSYASSYEYTSHTPPSTAAPQGKAQGKAQGKDQEGGAPARGQTVSRAAAPAAAAPAAAAPETAAETAADGAHWLSAEKKAAAAAAAAARMAVVVVGVEEDSLNAGVVRRGDELLAVDGVAVGGDYHGAVSLFRRHAATRGALQPLPITVRRRAAGYPMLREAGEDLWTGLDVGLSELDLQVLRVHVHICTCACAYAYA